MSQWANSKRREELPADWQRLRRRVLRRDGNRCTHLTYDKKRCDEVATEVDHVVPHSLGGSDSESNLAAICTFHHQAKSSAEGGAAAQAIRKRNAKKFDRREKHPGEL